LLIAVAIPPPGDQAKWKYSYFELIEKRTTSPST